MSPSEFRALLAKCGDYTIDDGERSDAQHDAYQFVWGNAYIFAELWEQAVKLHEAHVASEVYARHGAENPLHAVLAKLEKTEFDP